jgi:hypothetical protein
MAHAVFLALLLCLSVAADAQPYLDIAAIAPGPSLASGQPAALGASYMSSHAPQCLQSARADIPQRARLRETSSNQVNSRSSWGPAARRYPLLPAAAVPLGCNPAAWARGRVLAVIDHYVSLGLNYW